MPCMCGDSECPSCGTAQGTRTKARPKGEVEFVLDLQRLMKKYRISSMEAPLKGTIVFYDRDGNEFVSCSGMTPTEAKELDIPLL